MGKNFAVRVKCPFGDEDKWVFLSNCEESLQQILSTPVDFDCPVHGVQREMPMDASENGVRGMRSSQPSISLGASRVNVVRRASKRMAMRVPVQVFRWSPEQGAMPEESATIVVNAGGSLVPLSSGVALGEKVFVVNKSTQERQECRVAYVGPHVCGKTRVGLAFEYALPKFWRFAPKEPRLLKQLRVRVRGTDRNGSRFVQTAETVNISRHGARLYGVGYLTQPGGTLEVTRGWRSARFRVVWTGQPGTCEANHVGVCALEPQKNLWGKEVAQAPPAGSKRPAEKSAENSLTLWPRWH